MSKISELEEQSSAPGFWDDVENSQKVFQQTKQLKDKVERYDRLKGSWEDALVLVDLANEENDETQNND